MTKNILISANIGVIWLDLWTVWKHFNAKHNIDNNSIGIETDIELKSIEQEWKFSIYQRSNYRHDENGCLISEERTVLQSNITFDQILDDTVIEIFKDEIEGWFLDRLREIYPQTESKNRYHPNEMIALSVCMMYPETIQQYVLWIRSNRSAQINQKEKNMLGWFKKIRYCFYNWLSNGTSGKTFRDWFRRLQKNNISNRLINDFYSSVRCWLFHMASLNNNRYIRYNCSDVSDNAIIIEKNGNDKFIYLDNFIDAIHKDFESYIEEIRDDEILRNNLLGIYKGDLEKYFK